MSGGSFNYLYAWADDPEELFKRKADLKDMAYALSKLPYAKDAYKETERIIAILERLETQIAVRTEALKEVWHAVEWWQSGDSGEDRVKDALKKYREEE